MSPELETLDQLQGGELHLSIVATLFPSTAAFRRAVMGLLSCGDVILKTNQGRQLPRWEWERLFAKDVSQEEFNELKLLDHFAWLEKNKVEALSFR